MPFEDSSFDAVFCINSADHSQSPQAVISECARVLRPGGIFVFFVDLDSPLRKLHKRVRRNEGIAHPHSLTYGWLASQLEGRFVVEAECPDLNTFKPNWQNLRYEAYWDGLLYRLTKSPTWMHHVWIRARRVETLPAATA
jgi:SAM-dependent methyltransferase